MSPLTNPSPEGPRFPVNAPQSGHAFHASRPDPFLQSCSLKPGLSAETAASSPAAPQILSENTPHIQDLNGLPRKIREHGERLRIIHPTLYSEPVYQHPDGSRTFHNGILHKREGINVLFLKGDRFEMAFQHGRLLQEQAREGAIAQASRLIDNAIANSLGNIPFVTKAAASILQKLTTDRILRYSIKQVPDLTGSGIDDAIGLADATGLSPKSLIRAFFNPESLLILAKMTTNTHGQVVNVTAPASCCSCFAAWGESTRDGKMIIGRNMDFPLNGFYDRFPTVAYYEPTDGHQRYMTFVSAGVENPGLSSYNESGIFIACHTIPTKEMSVNRVPVFLTATDAIRQAHSFDDAVRILQSFKSPSGWGYLIASTKESRVGSMEFSSGHTAVREAEGSYHVQTNNYVIPEMRKHNLFLNRSVAEDNDGRFIRITECLDGQKSALDARGAMRILTDHTDPYTGEVRGLGATVGMFSTMTSLVMLPEENKVYVANGMGPVSHNSYVSLPLIDATTRDTFAGYKPEVVENNSFEKEHPEMHRAMQIFIEAKKAFEYENDSRRAWELMKEVVAADSSNPAYFFELAIFALRNKEYTEGRQALNQIFKTPYSTPQLERLGHYYLGRVAAHLGEKQEALKELKMVLDDPGSDAKLLSAAKWASWRTRIFGRCGLGNGSLNPGMQWADMMVY